MQNKPLHTPAACQCLFYSVPLRSFDTPVQWIAITQALGHAVGIFRTRGVNSWLANAPKTAGMERANNY